MQNKFNIKEKKSISSYFLSFQIIFILLSMATYVMRTWILISISPTNIWKTFESHLYSYSQYIILLSDDVLGFIKL